MPERGSPIVVDASKIVPTGVLGIVASVKPNDSTIRVVAHATSIKRAYKRFRLHYTGPLGRRLGRLVPRAADLACDGARPANLELRLDLRAVTVRLGFNQHRRHSTVSIRGRPKVTFTGDPAGVSCEASLGRTRGPSFGPVVLTFDPQLTISGAGEATLSWKPKISKRAKDPSRWSIEPTPLAVDTEGTLRVSAGAYVGVSVAGVEDSLTWFSPSVDARSDSEQSGCVIAETYFPDASDRRSRVYGACDEGVGAPGALLPSGSPLESDESYVCALRLDSTAACWGHNEARVAEAPSGEFEQLSTGRWLACGLRPAGEATCWGRYSLDPVPEGSFTQIATGGVHACVAKPGSRSTCWGSDYYGQTEAPAIALERLAAGDYHTCGLTASGLTRCWGLNVSGQASPPAGSFVELTAGASHTCGLRADGTAMCWGDDRRGQSSPPGGAFEELSAGGWTTCGRRQSGAVECWGYDNEGQASPPDRTFSRIAAGAWQSCGRHGDGTVECWGENVYGQEVSPGGKFDQIGAASEAFCGLQAGTAVECWGYGPVGRIEGDFTSVGPGSEETCMVHADGSPECWGWGLTSPPPEVKFTQIATGGDFSCGILLDQNLSCWGYLGSVYEGFGSDGPFTQVTGGGDSHLCGLRADGVVRCAGYYDEYDDDIWFRAQAKRQGPRVDRSIERPAKSHGFDPVARSKPAPGAASQVAAPRRVGTRYSWITSSAGADCGVTKATHEIDCWGYWWDRHGEPNGDDFKQVAIRGGTVCGLRLDGTVTCENGSGTIPSRPGEFTAITLGGGTCGHRPDRTVECWGHVARPSGSFP